MQVKVVDRSGEPLDGAAVELLAENGDTVFSTTTGITGAALLPLESGRHELAVSSEGFQPYRRDVGCQDGTEPIVVTLETRSPGFTTVDVRVGADLPWQLTLLAAFDNLADRYYYEHVNSLNPFTRQRIPERGRDIHFALSKRW